MPSFSIRIGGRRRPVSPAIGCLIFSIIFTLMGGIAVAFIAPPYIKANNYAEARCEILSKELLSQQSTRKSNNSRTRTTTYRPELTYQVLLPDGTSFETTGYGLSAIWTSDRNATQQRLDQFQVSNTYSCWYDPAAPTHAVLNKDLSFEDGSLTLLLVFGGIFALGALGLLGMIGVVIWGASRRMI